MSLSKFDIQKLIKEKSENVKFEKVQGKVKFGTNLIKYLLIMFFKNLLFALYVKKFMHIIIIERVAYQDINVKLMNQDIIFKLSTNLF
jgi:hypothetical protein